jgi:rhamnosyltransferase
MNTRYFCSLVMPTKNGGELFKSVVAGLQKQARWSEVEFIIVDSGSTDDTIETARGGNARVLTIPPEEFNHGATRDFAISKTSTDRIVMTVQDAIPNDPHMIEKLVAALDDTRVAGVYGRQIPQPDADVVTARNLNAHFTARLKREVRSLASHAAFKAMTPAEKYALCNFDNVCAALRKSIWENDKFGRINFGEDIDWAERVLKRGHKIVYEPASAVIHSHDRPLNYEYKRTYVCHRKLYLQYELDLSPTILKAIEGFALWTLGDLIYIARVETRWREKINLMLRMPILNFLRAAATYLAVRDEKAGKVKKVEGV